MNTDIFYSGYNKGLAVLCTQEEGFTYGSNEHTYNKVCPANLEPAFLKGYLPGLDAALANINDDLLSLDKRLATEKNRLSVLKSLPPLESVKKQIVDAQSEIKRIEDGISSRRATRTRLTGLKTTFS